MYIIGEGKEDEGMGRVYNWRGVRMMRLVFCFWRENISQRLVALVSLYDSCFNQNRWVDRLSPV